MILVCRVETVIDFALLLVQENLLNVGEMLEPAQRAEQEVREGLVSKTIVECMRAGNDGPVYRQIHSSLLTRLFVFHTPASDTSVRNARDLGRKRGEGMGEENEGTSPLPWDRPDVCLGDRPKQADDRLS